MGNGFCYSLGKQSPKVGANAQVASPTRGLVHRRWITFGRSDALLARSAHLSLTMDTSPVLSATPPVAASGRISPQIAFPAAHLACESDLLAMPTRLLLEKRLLAALVTVWTYGMRRFGGLHAFLQRVGQDFRVPLFFQFVALLFTVPCFKASHFCFKLGYFAQQRRILLLGGEDFGLQIDHRRVDRGSLVRAYQHLRDVHHRLEATYASKHFPHH